MPARQRVTLRKHLGHLRRKRLRAQLAAGYTAGADLDIEIAEAFTFVDREAERRLEHEAED